MSREASLNPIFLMGKTSTSSLYHSFYLVNIEDKNEMHIHFRFPKARRDIDDVESGVKYFLTELDLLTEDNFGSFVITTSDGSRFFASYRGSSSRLFVSVSIFPLMTFSRSVFSLLMIESVSSLPQVISTLCEFPIIDTPGARYDIKLSGGTLPLQFNRLGMVDDFDLYTVALRLLSPQMMVDAWECLMLEYKVLVISSSKEVIPHCCEFLRRMVSPLVVVNTYVPLLPSSLLNAIEAPFPYLLGAQADDVFSNFIDLTDTAVIYLDEQRVKLPANDMTPLHEMAPTFLKTTLMKEINTVMMKGLSQWAGRPSDGKERSISHSSSFYTACCSHPMSPNIQTNQAVKIFEIFLWQNLSLLGARHCDVRAFYRQCERPYYQSPTGEPVSRDSVFRMNVPKHRGADGRVSSMGFSCRSGVYCGCMQLLNERKDIDILQFLPCWVELDKERLAVHEFADEMPLISVLAKNIMAVSPSAAEPEGHVFDVHIGSQMTYRFAVTDPDSRREWIRVIEKMTTQNKSGSSPPPLLSHSDSSSSDVQTSSSTRSLHSSTDLESTVDSINIKTLEDDQINAFRMHVGHTQMVSYYKSTTDFEEFESILTGPGHRLESSSVLTAGYDVMECHVRTDVEVLPPAESPVLEKRLSSNQLRESDTELCSPLFVKDLANLWRLFISNEIPSEDLSTELTNMSSSTAKPNATLWLRQSVEDLKASHLFLGREERDYSKQKDILKSSASAIQDGLTLENAEKEKNFLTNLFFKSSTKDDQKKESSGAAQKKAANNIIKTELNLRSAASELVQRVASSHRQCEADLRKMLVNEKMICTANIIDCNTLMMLAGGGDATWDSISLDIKSVCESKVEERRNSWNEVTSEWVELFQAPSTCASSSLCGGDEASLKTLRYNIKLSIQQEMKQRKEPNPFGDGSGSDNSDCDSHGSVDPYVEGDEEFVQQTTTSTFPSHILIPLLQSMDGYSCRQSKNKYSAIDQRKLIATYGKGSLMDQKRLMRCLVAIFLDWSEVDEHTASENNKKKLVDNSNEDKEKEGACNNDMDSSSSESNSKSHPLEIPDTSKDVSPLPPSPPPPTNTTTRSKQSEQHRNVISHLTVKDFLFWAVGINDIIGLQAVRLISELMHTCLTNRMAERIAEQSQALEITSTAGEFEREVAHGIYSRKRVSISNMQPTFIWANNTAEGGGGGGGGVVRDKSSHLVLNESVLCKNTASKACELSIQLLSSLREILRAANASGTLNNDRRMQPGNSFCMQLTEAQRDEICKSSAFRSFEFQSCQMQMVDIDGLDDNSKAVFFCNIFNVMTIHAVMYGLPNGTSFYEKYNFMRNTKYNISGMTLSLLDIEHNILRAQTSSPYSIFGPVSIKTSSFSEKDSRYKLALKKAFPLVSFVLFTASASSPPLTTLWDPTTVKQEMRRSTAQYLQEYIQIDHKNKVILVPEQVRWYWKDFGGSKMKVLNTVIHLCVDTPVASEISDLLKITQKPRIAFVNFDWAFVLKL